MPLVATLVSHPNAPALTPEIAAKAAEALGTDIDWLTPCIAADFHLPEGACPAQAEDALRQAVGVAPVDIAVQDAADRRKKMLIADMDSTMIDQECIDELADVIGIKSHVAAITARAMNGEIAFEPALRERVALLKGLRTEIIAQVIAERISLASGGRELVATMNAAGAWTILVSGGFDIFTAKVAAMLGFREQQANRLLVEAEALTGMVAEPILGRAAKAEALRAVSARLGIGPADVVAVGDGANDLDMIRLAGMGVALHAKPTVAAEARFRIDHGDLTALLYLQGYRQEEFVR
jgi:phosphoserine phosphatase